MSDYRAPRNDKTHPADEWVGEARTVQISGKPVATVIATLTAKAEGLDDARLRVAYSGEPYLTGFRPKTQAEKDQEAKKRAAQEAADAKRQAEVEARQAKQKAERAAQDAAWAKQEKAAREQAKTRELEAAKRQARLIAAQLRDMGFVPTKKREAKA
jgi:hypothetical protein